MIDDGCKCATRASSNHRVLQDVGRKIKKLPLPIGSHQSTISPRYEQVTEPFLDSRNREGALSTAKRRAGDVAVLKPAKSVSPKLDLATPRGG
jgi:enabled protein